MNTTQQAETLDRLKALSADIAFLLADREKWKAKAESETVEESGVKAVFHRDFNDKGQQVFVAMIRLPNGVLVTSGIEPIEPDPAAAYRAVIRSLTENLVTELIAPLAFKSRFAVR